MPPPDTSAIHDAHAAPHPARRTSFDALEAGLHREAAAGSVISTRDGDLELFVYTNGCVFDRQWNPFTLIARRLMTRCTPLAIWEAMFANDDLAAMRRDLPEEFARDFDVMHQLLTARVDALLAELARAHEATSHLSNKELGLLMRSAACDLPPIARELLFVWRRGNFARQLIEDRRVRQALFRSTRPDHNRLPGYAPSSAVDRFVGEE